MSYQEKRTLVSIFSGLAVLVAYCTYGYIVYMERGLQLLSDLRFWAVTMLVSIAVFIAIMILVQIMFHIMLSVSNEVKKEVSKQARLNGKDMNLEVDEISDLEDEMDRLIGLKSMRNSFFVVSIGFILSLIAVLLGSPGGIMMNIIYVSFIIGMISDGCSQLYFYRKGISNV